MKLVDQLFQQVHLIFKMKILKMFTCKLIVRILHTVCSLIFVSLENTCQCYSHFFKGKIAEFVFEYLFVQFGNLFMC